MHRHRRAVGATAVVLLVVLCGQPALAGGGFTSYFRDWLPGTSSRTWNDSARDANRTYIALDGCRRRANPSLSVTLRIQLTKETPVYLPDKNLGRQDYACHARKVTHSWAPQVGGSYHFTLTHVNGSTQAPDKVSASEVGVVY